jgi:hypothetical protein
MHRRNLTVRRFGALSFGLGYFEDGVWVDHAVADGLLLQPVADEDRPASDRVDAGAVHQWYTCCAHAGGEPSDIPDAAVFDEASSLLRVAGRSAP